MTGAAGVAMRAITVGATLAAGPTATVLAGGTAGGGRGTVAVATGVSHTADLRGKRRIATLLTKVARFVVGSITCTSTGGRRVGTENLRAPFGAVPVTAENAANAAQTKQAAERCGNDEPERVAP